MVITRFAVIGPARKDGGFAMKKMWLLVLLVLVWSSSLVYAQESCIIKEIIVIGNTRTTEQVIRSQLPFRAGDIWRDEYRQWAVARLKALAIFAYEPLRIIVESLNEDECRVIVRLADPAIFYRDPAEFAIMTSVELLYRQFSPTLFNPFGSGQNINLDMIWGHNFSYGGSITSPLGAGVITFGGRYYRSDRRFFDLAYTSGGWNMEAGYRYWWKESLRQTTELNYHNFELDGSRYEFVIPKLSFYYTSAIDAEISLVTGLSLTNDPSFWQTQAVVLREQDPFFGLLRGGYTSFSTPLNHRFATGGFGTLPLRGEGLWHLSRAYILGTLEYHHPLNDMLVPIGFIDGGWLWKEDSPPGLEGGIVNIGLGIAFYTPLGIPVRFDLAANPISKDWGWNIGFGHTFRAPY